MLQSVDGTDVARMQYFGIERTEIQGEFDLHLEHLHLDGFTILENVLSADECDMLSKRLDELNEAQNEKYGRARLEQLNDFGVLRAPLSQDDCFLQLAMHPAVLRFVDHLIGSTAILHLQNAIILEPNKRHHQAGYHRDFAKNFVCDKLLSLNAMFAINEFSPVTGGTLVVPGSHLHARIASDDYLSKHAVQVSAPRGSVFLFDSLLVHKAGDNRSDQFRRAVNHQYTRPFIKQQLDLPVLMKGQVPMESRAAQLLGMWTLPPRSVEEYRVDPADRTYRGGQG